MPETPFREANESPDIRSVVAGPARIGPGLVDRMGTWLGMACAVHCLALPLFIGVLPFLGLQFLADEGIEIGFIGIGVTFALLAALWGVRRHGALRVAAAFAAAVGVLLLGFRIGEETVEGRVVMAIGALALVLSHRTNRKLCASCPEDGDAQA